MNTPRTLISFALALSLGLGASSCTNDATFYYGEPLAGMKLSLYDSTVGIYPSKTVLADPENPFAHAVMGDQTKWDVQSSGELVAAFYAWATVNARQPYGESQYYVAFNLKGVYLSGAADIDELPAIRAQAIRAYQTVLDYFPDAVTYDASGTQTFDLATPSYQAILELGGKVQGGWILLQSADGQPKAMKP
jgi:hypothetical protein